MFENGVDQGYLSDPNWWFNKGPHQFRIAKLDEDYPAEYFEVAGVPDSVIDAYCTNVDVVYRRLVGRTFKSSRGLIEFGAGGGWFTKEFQRRGFNIDAIEGSSAGYRMMELNRIYGQKKDIRETMPWLEQKYDMALCSEVLEHIEPYFHGVVVGNLCRTAHMVWFSSEDPEVVKNKAHLHHSGEMPLVYWKKLFAWFNFECFMLPDRIYEATAGRSRCIFYNKYVHQDDITKNGFTQ